MASYTVKPNDSWARIAGQAYGNQRWYNELANANGGLGRMLHPGDVIELPDFDTAQTPVITQATWDATPRGSGGGYGGDYGGTTGGSATGPAMPNVGMPSVPTPGQKGYMPGANPHVSASGPAYRDPRYNQGPRYNQPAAGTGKQASGRAGGAQPKAAPVPAWMTSAQAYRDPRQNQGPRWTPQPKPSSSKPGGTPLAAGTKPSLPAWNPRTELPGMSGIANPIQTKGTPKPPPDKTQKDDVYIPLPGYPGGPGPQDPYRPLNPFEINTGAMYYGMALQEAITTGDRSKLPPMIGDVYWQSMMPPKGYATMEDFLTDIGYRMDDTGQWRLFNPKVSTGYGGGSGYGGYTQAAEPEADYGGYGGGGGGYSYPAFTGVSRGRNEGPGLVNWRIG